MISDGDAVAKAQAAFILKSNKERVAAAGATMKTEGEIAKEAATAIVAIEKKSAADKLTIDKAAAAELSAMNVRIGNELKSMKSKWAAEDASLHKKQLAQLAEEEKATWALGDSINGLAIGGAALAAMSKAGTLFAQSMTEASEFHLARRGRLHDDPGGDARDGGLDRAFEPRHVHDRANQDGDERESQATGHGCLQG